MNDTLPPQSPEATEFQDLQAMRALLALEKDARAQACQAAIQRVLDEFNCEMRPFPQILPDGRIVGNLLIVALEVK